MGIRNRSSPEAGQSSAASLPPPETIELLLELEEGSTKPAGWDKLLVDIARALKDAAAKVPGMKEAYGAKLIGDAGNRLIFGTVRVATECAHAEMCASGTDGVLPKPLRAQSQAVVAP